MLNRIFFSFILIFSIFGFCQVKAQGTSNEGTEFWAVFPSHVPANINGVRPLANYSIFITGKQASSGIVTVGTFQTSFILPQANSVIEVQIPRAQAYINETESGRVLSNRAIRVQVDPGKPKVVVYGHIFAGARSAASLILPKEALGQQYFSMNYEIGNTLDGGQNHIVLVASEPDTKIFIRKNGTDLVPGGILLKNVGDAYEYLSNSDLTGTSVFVDPQTSGCKQFAMFSGTTNSAIMIPNVCLGRISSDPLYQQNYPVESWGTSYGFIPFSMRSLTGSPTRTNGNYIRILAKDDNTQVSYNGNQIVTLNSGQFYQTPLPVNQPAYITANKAIAVSQYSLTQSCAGGFGDPDMVILNPIEYNIRNITVYSSNKENISENYVNILIKTSAAASFRINGKAPNGTFTILPASPGLSYMQLNLNQYPTQIFNLSASDGFNAIAYGFGDVESYAYSAGTNLASSQSVKAINKITLEEITNACTNQDLDFVLTLTSPAASLTWQLDISDPPVLQNNPAYTPVTRNGIIYYEYIFPRNLGYKLPGEKMVKVTATYSSAAGCTLDEQIIDYSFDVFDPPKALFTKSVNLCANNEIVFTDQSVDNGNAITSWLWDFGDGQTSTEQNPKHIYSFAGSYTVILKVKNSTSCNAIEYKQDLLIRALPIADFSMSLPGCNNSGITFTDSSVPLQGRIIKWNWDLGDGTLAEYTNGLPFLHQYTAGGSYKVSLKVTNEFGCDHTFNRTLNITTPFLDAGSDTIILRGGGVKFNVSATGTNLKFKWSPSVGLDRDDVQNPVASPTENTKYSVVITSDEGCVLEDDILVEVLEKPLIPNTFTPNGDGVNDVWRIKYLDSYPNVTVNIFNRYGVRVYASIGYIEAWSGIFNGTALPVGTYYYVIDPKISLPVFRGWVTVIR
jgi:gliding motility-associated-like protein